MTEQPRILAAPAGAPFETRTDYSREYSFLYRNHLQLLMQSAISPEVSRLRGYRTVTTASALRRYGFADYQCRVPALLLPIYDLRGRLVSYQIRPDEPRVDAHGGLVEYESVTRQPIVDAPLPPTAPLNHTSVLYITDGVRKADSAASRGLCCIDLPGIRSWARNGDDPSAIIRLPDWNHLQIMDRVIRIVHDADVIDAAETLAVMNSLAGFLHHRGAKVQVIMLNRTRITE